MQTPKFSPLLLVAALGWAFGAPAFAKPAPVKVGFDKIVGRFSGGYQIDGSAGSISGPATVRVRSLRKGLAGKIDWINTFYTARGSYRVALRWDFRASGAMIAKSIDPRVGGKPATGVFTASKRRITPFRGATRDSLVTAVGTIETRGGGSLFISVTLRGLPEGDVTYSFSGGRIRG